MCGRSPGGRGAGGVTFGGGLCLSLCGVRGGVWHCVIRQVQTPLRLTPLFVASPQSSAETVLREAMQALVRVHAHMLARIVVEIRSAGLVVELEP